MFDRDEPKSTLVAYLLWALLGTVGLHKFYLGRTGMGILYACTLGLFFVGTLVDMFTLPSQVRAANARIAGGGHPHDIGGRIADLPDPGRLDIRSIDEMIARYKAMNAAAAARAAAAPAPARAAPRRPSGPQFGRRTSFPAG